ncbi:MAG: hypothetical protein RJA70_2206 [Pseudomonadota bacterium]|jgi:phosphate uptake regulator
MFLRLFKALAGDEPEVQSTVHFGEMMELVEGMVVFAHAVYWGKVQTAAERSALYERDVRVNKLQRQTRREVVASLSGPVPGDVPYGLMLMSLVKDIERLGDYAKNLAEVPSLTHDNVAERVLPDDENVEELRHISDSIMLLAREAKRVYVACDKERAAELTAQGRANAKRCDKLVAAIARSDYPACVTVDLTLAVRFYKRIQGHLLNLLSSVIMPLDKLDYYDAKSFTQD